MRTNLKLGSTKIRLILTLLIGALSVSAITLGDTILAPIGFAHEGSSAAKLESNVKRVGSPKRVRPGKLPGLTSPSMFAFQTTIDDSGADDEPGQKDLTLMAVDFGAPGSTTFNVVWQWDNTATTGNNTRDAGALFDTDDDGNANYSLYITINTNGTFKTQLFVCTADSRADRCGGPDEVLPPETFASTAQIFTNGIDPFGPNGSSPTASHSTGNTCIGRPGCYSLDTKADVNAVLSDFGNPADIVLLNVCSYPSGEPNSDPSDCVVENPPGFLTLVKVVNNFGESGAGYKGVSDFPLTINGASTPSGTAVSVVAGNYTIAETSQTGYTVGTWTCTDGTTGTAGSVSATVNVASGEAVTCTMTNTLIANPAILLDKTAVTVFSTPAKAGDKITYTFQITNTGNVTLTGVDLDDTLLGYSNIVCGTATLAPGASTSCNADYFLTQANVDAGTVSNTATACGDPPAGVTPTEVCSSDGTTTTIIGSRTLSLVKTARIKTITYSFVITNTGTVTLSTVALSDSKLGSVTGCDKATLAPGATAECSADYTVTAQDITNGYVTNTATATASGGVITTASVTITPLTVVSQ